MPLKLLPTMVNFSTLLSQTDFVIFFFLTHKTQPKRHCANQGMQAGLLCDSHLCSPGTLQLCVSKAGTQLPRGATWKEEAPF